MRTVLCQLPINQSSLIIKKVFTWFLVHITVISQSMFCSVGLSPATILSFLAKMFCNISRWVGVTERGSRLTLQMKYLPDQPQHFRVLLILNFIIRDERSFHLSKKKPNYVSYTFHQNIYRSSLPVGMYFIILSRISTKWKKNGIAINYISFVARTDKQNWAEAKIKLYRKAFSYFSDLIQSPVHHIPA